MYQCYIKFFFRIFFLSHTYSATYDVQDAELHGGRENISVCLHQGVKQEDAMCKSEIPQLK